MIADYLDEMDAEIRGIRALAMEAGVVEELAARTQQLLDSGLFETLYGSNQSAQNHLAQLKDRKRRGRRLTPLLKYAAAENAVKHARLALKILVGVVYTKEYAAEQLLRAAVVMPIYEGTSQIQSLMAMKDTLGSIIKDPKVSLSRGPTRWRAMSSRCPLNRRVHACKAFHSPRSNT